MRRNIGNAAVGLAAIGVMLAYIALFQMKSKTDLPILMFVGAAVYLVGSFGAVVCFGYVRGTPLFWALAVMRLLFAGAVIFMISRGFSS